MRAISNPHIDMAARLPGSAKKIWSNPHIDMAGRANARVDAVRALFKAHFRQNGGSFRVAFRMNDRKRFKL